MKPLPTPHPVDSNRFVPRNPGSKCLVKPFPQGDLKAANASRAKQTSDWAKLDLRQSFADETWMRSHIKAAGLRSPVSIEPATTARLRSMLKKAGLTGLDITDAVGATLARFLQLNPGLPLWAALALVLESTGRFIVKTAEDAATAVRPVKRS